MVDVRDLHDLTSSWCTKSSRGETNERYIIVESFFFLLLCCSCYCLIELRTWAIDKRKSRRKLYRSKFRN